RKRLDESSDPVTLDRARIHSGTLQAVRTGLTKLRLAPRLGIQLVEADLTAIVGEQCFLSRALSARGHGQQQSGIVRSVDGIRPFAFLIEIAHPYFTRGENVRQRLDCEGQYGLSRASPIRQQYDATPLGVGERLKLETLRCWIAPRNSQVELAELVRVVLEPHLAQKLWEIGRLFFF